MKLGAFDFLPKPLNMRELVSVILSAVDQDRRQAPKRLEERILRSRIASLTPREREVLPLVVGGLLNKQAASLLGISEITLQIHRGSGRVTGYRAKCTPKLNTCWEPCGRVADYSSIWNVNLRA